MTADRREARRNPWIAGRRWLLAMRWHHLLFAHWPLPSAVLRPHVPAGLELDRWDGTAWLGVVPFRMSGVRPRLLPPLPWLSAFPELNVRTYVVRDGRPGVFFFSLDAARTVAVRLARRGFGLPYFDAAMRCTAAPEGWIDYASRRTDRREPPAELRCRYRPTGPAAAAAPGTLEHFLTERLCLYSVGPGGRLLRGDIDHEPWPLQPAEWEAEAVDLTRLLGAGLPDRPPHLRFARFVAVRAWRPVHCP